MKPRNLKDRLTKEDMLSIKHKYLEGVKNKDLAFMFGISTASVKRLAKRMELPNKNSIHHSGEISQHPIKKNRILKSVELYKKKHSTWEIAQELGIDDETVRGYLKRMGVRMRDTAGQTKNMKTRQNKIIKAMYLRGAILKDIMLAAKIGKKGIDNRLRNMGIPRSRHPYYEIHVGDKFDDLIKQLFLQGSTGKDIAKKIKLGETAVCYRLRSIIFKNHEFELRYFSRLTDRWKTMRRTPTTRKLRAQIMRLSKHLNYTPKIDIKPICDRFRR